MMVSKPCTYCGGLTHTSLMCQKKPRKPLIAKKPMKKKGPKTSKWLKFRKRYLGNHPPNSDGYYTCYLCCKWVKPDQVTLDHMESRSRRPELVFDESNIRIACWDCNNSKGSLSTEEFLERKRNANNELIRQTQTPL